MKTIAYLTLVGGLALACAAPTFADPMGDGVGEGGASDSFTSPPPLGPDVANYINSLPPPSGGQAIAVTYDTTGYVPTANDGLGNLQISWSDIAGLTTGAYDQYWATHTAPPPPPPALRQFHGPNFHNNLSFNAPTGNLGESDAAGEGYMFSVTARSIRFVQLVPEPAPLVLVVIGIAALALVRRRTVSN
jgi:hypothetical protein